MEKCTDIFSDKAIRLPDCGKVVILKNPNRKVVSRIRFDGCVVKNVIAADYLVSVKKKNDFFVELKGRAVEHAIDQIAESARYLKENYPEYRPNIGVIFCKQVPSGSASINRKREKLYKEHGIDLKISSSKNCFCLEKLIFE